jgi:hypothetical protein
VEGERLPRSDLAATIGRIAATTLADGAHRAPHATLRPPRRCSALARTGPHDPAMLTPAAWPRSRPPAGRPRRPLEAAESIRNCSRNAQHLRVSRGPRDTLIFRHSPFEAEHPCRSRSLPEYGRATESARDMLAEAMNGPTTSAWELFLEVDTDNLPALRLYRPGGVLRRRGPARALLPQPDGTWADAYVMAYYYGKEDRIGASGTGSRTLTPGQAQARLAGAESG